jgi:hypothetical protein
LSSFDIDISRSFNIVEDLGIEEFFDKEYLIMLAMSTRWRMKEMEILKWIGGYTLLGIITAIVLFGT